MLSFEPELEALRNQLGNAATDALIARERREVFSVYPELRLAGWLGAMLLAAAAGLTLKNHLDRIGPLALALLIGIAAAACYTWTWLRRARISLVDDYVLLLGALLVSADVAFVESQFHLLDAEWKHHLIVIAAFHAAGAYAYGSRMLLALAIMALAGWIGFSANDFFGAGAVWRPALLAAGAVIVWREIDRRAVSSGVSSRAKSRDSLPAAPSPSPEESSGRTPFSRTFEHFAANFALIGGLALSHDHEILGSLLTMVIAAGVIAWGFSERSEPFVLYGFVYGVIALDILLIDLFGGNALEMLVIAVSMIGAIAGLLVLHARFKEATR